MWPRQRQAHLTLGAALGAARAQQGAGAEVVDAVPVARAGLATTVARDALVSARNLVCRARATTLGSAGLTLDGAHAAAGGQLSRGHAHAGLGALHLRRAAV